MPYIHCNKNNTFVQSIVIGTLISLRLIEHKFYLEKSSVSPQTIESGSIAATGITDEIRSKAESNTLYCKGFEFISFQLAE